MHSMQVVAHLGSQTEAFVLEALCLASLASSRSLSENVLGPLFILLQFDVLDAAQDVI